jgi:LemA protein
MQIKANTASSTIDVQLKQRRDTLIKLVDACKSSIKFENETLTQITSLRKVNSFVNNKDSSSNIKALDNMSSKILATVENYPNLQSVAVIRDLMSSADYLEREIAASRRVYNAVVNEFNEKLYV